MSIQKAARLSSLRPLLAVVAYAAAVVANSKRLAATLSKREFAIVSGGTDTHLMLVDVFSKGITGSVTYGADVHVPQKGVTMIAVTGGKFTLGAEVVPEKVPAP